MPSTLADPVKIRDQVYDFLSNHADLTAVKEWAKDALYTIADEVALAEMDFPCGAVIFFAPMEFRDPTIKTSPFVAGNVRKNIVTIWVTIVTSRNTLQLAGDQALGVAQDVQEAILNTRNLLYNDKVVAHSTCETVAMKHLRSSLEEDSYYGMAAIKVDITYVKIPS